MAQSSDRYRHPPHRIGAKRTRKVLVDDAMSGVPTPWEWMSAALWFLGGRSSAGAEREFADLCAEVRSKGGVMPGAPGAPRSVP